MNTLTDLVDLATDSGYNLSVDVHDGRRAVTAVSSRGAAHPRPLANLRDDRSEVGALITIRSYDYTDGHHYFVVETLDPITIDVLVDYAHRLFLDLVFKAVPA